MKIEYLLLIDVSNSFRCDVRGIRKSMNHLAEEVSKDNDRVMSINHLWELDDEVNFNSFSRRMRNFKWLDSGSKMLGMFPLGTSFTAFYTFLDKGSYVRPPIVCRIRQRDDD